MYHDILFFCKSELLIMVCPHNSMTVDIVVIGYNSLSCLLSFNVIFFNCLIEDFLHALYSKPRNFVSHCLFIYYSFICHYLDFCHHEYVIFLCPLMLHFSLHKLWLLDLITLRNPLSFFILQTFIFLRNYTW
jgi:hypothetical protein